MADSEILTPSIPSVVTLGQIGLVNYYWAALDALTSAAYIAALKGDAIEIGVTLGELDTIAKVQKLKKIYTYRKDAVNTLKLAALAKSLDKLKPLRNAFTHGWYLGQTQEGEICYALMPQFVIDDEFAGTGFFSATQLEISEHVQGMAHAIGVITGMFEIEELRQLFDLPSRMQTANQPKSPRPKPPKGRPRRDRSSQA